MKDDDIIRFDWAAKRILRDKANFGVFEGLITVLLGEKITISQILESESNQDDNADKFNRVDIKAINTKGEIILVEIQQTRQFYFLQRMLYGVAKTITEHIGIGDDYDKVKKVYSINILYFDLGKGADYLYHGKSTFIGVHTKDTLQVNVREKDQLRMVTPDTVFPEYYIIRVNEFNQVAKTPIEEWMDYLKRGYIKDDTTTPGLAEAREKLQYIKMTPEERRAYDRHIDNIRVQNDVMDTAHEEGYELGKVEGRAEGMAEGMAEGRAEGRAEGMTLGKIEIARSLKKSGMPHEQISLHTGLSEAEIDRL
ncbi:MAG: PD-(D/E)XK nuclease family transposase [Bacteroidales bacterium]|nr:PD-(D/E)XK nuclease family transposase [Bacteroidales bacterium]